MTCRSSILIDNFLSEDTFNDISTKVSNSSYYTSGTFEEPRDELCNEIISYLPDNFELVLRLDIPNTFPINNLFISYHELKNTFLFLS